MPTSDPLQSRGYRNRNPGNIDYVQANKWLGQTGLGDEWLPAVKRRFAAFKSHEYGIRALAALLTTYQDRYGLRTVRQIVNRWAPPSENETGAYAQHVAKQLDRAPDALLDLHSHADMRGLVIGIITHELGGNPYPDVTIDAGLRLAGLIKPVTSLASAASTPEGKTALGIASLATAASVAAPAVQALAALPQWVGVAVVAAVMVVAVTWILLGQHTAQKNASA